MTRYISLIRKQDFADLYKYGTFHANKDLVIEVVGDIEHIRSCQNYFTEITKLANPFESTFTYLFVYYQKTDEESRYYDIEIETGVAINARVMLRQMWENFPIRTPFRVNVINEGIVL